MAQNSHAGEVNGTFRPGPAANTLVAIFILHMIELTYLVAVLAGIFSVGSAHPNHHARAVKQMPLGDPKLTINGIPFWARAYWMRQANLALNAPCPFAAFGSVIVNHTGSTGPGTLVCTGANSNSLTGNPTLHGEMAAINNCSAILTEPNGPYKLKPSAALNAFADLTLYTNAESCPMCASAIRWAGFKEYVYGTSIDTLIERGWGQIRIASVDIFAKSFDLGKPTRLMGEVLTEETDPYFLWQFDPDYQCPEGCGRVNGTCKAK